MDTAVNSLRIWSPDGALFYNSEGGLDTALPDRALLNSAVRAETAHGLRETPGSEPAVVSWVPVVDSGRRRPRGHGARAPVRGRRPAGLGGDPADRAARGRRARRAVAAAVPHRLQRQPAAAPLGPGERRAGPAGRAHRPAQPTAAQRPPGARRRGQRAHRGLGRRCCCSTSTGSRRSTTPWATRAATSCSSRSPSASVRRRPRRRHRRPARRRRVRGPAADRGQPGRRRGVRPTGSARSSTSRSTSTGSCCTSTPRSGWPCCPTTPTTSRPCSSARTSPCTPRRRPTSGWRPTRRPATSTAPRG